MREKFLVTTSITMAVTMEMTVSAGLMKIMVTSVATMVMEELMICGVDWPSIWRRVSTSLV